MSKYSSWSQLESLFIHLGEKLDKPASLMIIGSVVGMSLGQDDRMTADFDVWRPDSVFDLNSLKSACEAVGIVFNPQWHDEPDGIYLQMVDPGIVQIGKYSKKEVIFKSGNLEVVRPPLVNIIASKLVRGDERDIEDSVFLMTKFSISIDSVRLAIESIEVTYSKETALENLVLLKACFDSTSNKVVRRRMGLDEIP